MRMIRRLIMALAGRRIWKRLKKAHSIGDKAILVLMPESDVEINKIALDNMDSLLAHRKVEKACIMAADERVKSSIAAIPGGACAAIDCRDGDIRYLMAYCELYKFTEYLVVVSFTRPFGNRTYKALGHPDLTIEDLVCICAFGIRNWQKIQPNQAQDAEI